jgi:aminoglycoside phosphotransferase (APT) family kinase protein
MITDDSLKHRVTHYLSQECGRAISVQNLVRFPVGFSWLTYGVTLSGLDHDAKAKELILRLGPDYGLFAPYSAYPQALAMESLQGSGVPIPKSFWRSDDASILGAPFLFCEKVKGSAVLPWASAALAPLADDFRLRLAEQFISALAALHRAPWQNQSIAPMGTGITCENAAETQIQFWTKEYQRWAMRSYPLMEWGLHWLQDNKPRAPTLSIIHGDYRTGNFLEENGTITSILDWELTHIGDPHEDLGWASLPMYMGGTKLVCRLIETDQFFERYQAQVPFTVSPASVKFYRVFSLMKLAATHMAAARCFEEGRFNDLRMPAMGSQIIPVLRQMEKAIEAA